MPTWYHFTGTRRFQLDPDHRPVNYNDTPGKWVQYGGEDNWNGQRPYVVEIEAPDDLQFRHFDGHDWTDRRIRRTTPDPETTAELSPVRKLIVVAVLLLAATAVITAVAGAVFNLHEDVTSSPS